MTARKVQRVQLRTERAWMMVREEGDLLGPIAFVPHADQPTPEQVPVLVVPEAAVRGCRHEDQVFLTGAEWCRDCGSLRYYADAVSHQLRPKLLCVSRRK